jgi:HAD superfamily hydrolase (TIGR01509 family)
MILLLDVMGTLVHDPFHREMPEFFGLTFQQMLEHKHPTAWVEFERGEIDERTFARRFFADERRVDPEAFREHIRGSYRWLPGIEPLLAELRQQGVAMHALSNYPRWYRLIEERLGLSRYLEWSFVSCETGLRKPAPEPYRHAVRALGVAPEQCLFVDDRERNCEPARELGMEALRFEDAEQLRTALQSRGILQAR